MTTKTETKTVVIPEVDEITGTWVTKREAAKIIGIEEASVTAKVHQGKFKSIRIAGIILCEKKSVQDFAATRALERAKAEERKAERETEKLAKLPWNKISKLFESYKIPSHAVPARSGILWYGKIVDVSRSMHSSEVGFCYVKVLGASRGADHAAQAPEAPHVRQSEVRFAPSTGAPCRLIRACLHGVQR